jgi:ribosomal protein S18 acetylase RimI-like enzyme
MTPEAARRDEIADAFRLLFPQFTPEERERRVAHALGLVERGDLDPHGVLVLREVGGLLGAIVCVPTPGAGALMWPPSCLPGPDRAGHEDALVRHGCAWLRVRGARLAQALLAPEDMLLAAPLLRNGFDHVTHLWFLRHDLSDPPPGRAVPRAASCPWHTVRLDYLPYDGRDPAAFHQTLLRTYEGTLDCPEVNGVRTVEEVVAGHRAQGVYEPARWLLARQEGVPVGVLLLMAAEGGEWEVAYVGVVPEARGRGVGRELMLKALVEARAGGARRLVLSVDGRNRPAWGLYRGLGFEPNERREVFLAVWDRG